MSAFTDLQRSGMQAFWGMLTFVSAALGVVEVVGQRRTLLALENLCSLAECGNLFHLTSWIVVAQMVVCAAVIIYVSSCAFLLSRPVTGYRLAVALLLALVFCSFQLIAAIGQFAKSTSIVGLDGASLDAENEQVAFGLRLCLTVVFVLMVLLVCADHAQHVASSKLPSFQTSKYVDYSSMLLNEGGRARRLRLRCRRKCRQIELDGAGDSRELYPILEAEVEDEENEREPS